MKQKTISFKYSKHEFYPKGYEPSDALNLSDSIKNRLLNKGYLVKNIKEEEVIMVTCLIAKANIPFKERIKKQKEIDNMPKDTNITLFKKSR